MNSGEFKSITTVLEDQCSTCPTEVPTAVGLTQNFIQVEAEGFSCMGSADDQPLGEGGRSIVAIEVWEGRLRCIVWADINQEDPTHIIDLEQARISNRSEEDPLDETNEHS